MRARLVVSTALALLMTGAVACTGDVDEPVPAPDSPPSDQTGADDEASVSSNEADCDPARPVEPTGTAQSFSHDGQERSYLLELPADDDGRTAQPLLLGFHGFGGSKEAAAEASQLGEKGTARGYVVVYPDALGQPRAWNYDPTAGADDFGFIHALVTDLTERLCIDPGRVYAAGHSNGSAFTGFLACNPPYQFAAVAMVAAFVPTTCPVDQAAPAVVAVHGIADPGVPYYGGLVAGGPAQIPPALSTLDGYRDAYRCDPSPVEEQPRPGVQRRAYNGCIRGSEAVLYSVVDGGHEWPRERFAASDAILDFFDAHS